MLICRNLIYYLYIPELISIIAGSEKIEKSGVEGKNLDEAKKIN